MRGVLVDAGPLVALLDQSDKHHEPVVGVLRQVRDPLLTVWPPIVEAMYLLGYSWQAQKALWEILEANTVRLLALDEGDVPRMKELMEKYRDLPMDMADAALVRVAERENLRRVLTVDHRDFSVYRLWGKESFSLLP